MLQHLFDEAERRPLTVSELTAQVREALEARFPSVWVEGEISNFKDHTSGHWYFTIKDEGAQIRATCFRGTNARIRFRPYDGLQVRARGHLTVYEPRGEYELCVESLDPVGIGALRIAFEQLRNRLAAEGLFDQALKRPLPLLPRRVGVVTSPSGAAIHDILRVITRRTRTVSILLAPVRVQGEGASQEIARAIALLNEYHRQALQDGRFDDRVDAIIVGRGGGSIEDLWAFNEEEVARAIRASAIPVISAVGHETDFTIADFAADLRAPTPSAAAEMVAACEDSIAARLADLTRTLVQAVRLHTLHARTRLQETAMSSGFDETRARLRLTRARNAELHARLEAAIKNRLRSERKRTAEICFRITPKGLSSRFLQSRIRLAKARAALEARIEMRIDGGKSRLSQAVASLEALSPLAVLRRGYALVQKEDGSLVQSANDVREGEKLNLRLADGKLRCRVEGIEST